MREDRVEGEERERVDKAVPHRGVILLLDDEGREDEERRDRSRCTGEVEPVINRCRAEDARDADDLRQQREREQDVDGKGLQGSSSRSKKRTNTIPPAKVRMEAATPRIVYEVRWKPWQSVITASAKMPPQACSPTRASSRGATKT